MAVSANEKKEKVVENLDNVHTWTVVYGDDDGSSDMAEKVSIPLGCPSSKHIWTPVDTIP